MRFIVDAQLPRLLSDHLATLGQDAMHVKELPGGAAASDAQITRVADREGRVVVTKDADFLESHLLGGEPRRLLRITTGNISNADLLALFTTFMPALEIGFGDADHVDVSVAGLLVYPRESGGSD